MESIDVRKGIAEILQRIELASLRRKSGKLCALPLLVAVSKTKPIDLILDAYAAGQRHFGENYVKELWDKSTNELLAQKCPDIKWHFIGHVQSNQVNKLLKVPRLEMVQTVDSIKLADVLDKKWPVPAAGGPLKILIQVNTSSEDEKSGIDPLEVLDLYQHITENCKNLSLSGLMTIGRFGYDYSQGPNPDFLCLLECRARLCNAYSLDTDSLNISMGMSDDFEHAVEMGSTIVRVGSSIFGYRLKKNEKASASD